MSKGKLNTDEFKKYVIAEATKYLFSKESEVPAETLKTIKENVKIEVTQVVTNPIVSPSEIKKLAEEMKKINKSIDLRNPLISESDESLVESIMNQNNPSKGTPLNLGNINKKKHIGFQNEDEKSKWNRMLNYDVPNDEERP